MYKTTKTKIGSVLGNAWIAMFNAKQNLITAFIGVIVMIAPLTPAQAQSLGTIGDTVASSGAGLKNVIMTVFAVIGIGMVGFALIKWKNASKSGEGMGGIIGMMVIGAILLSVTAVIGVFQTTVFGTNNAAEGLDLLN